MLHRLAVYVVPTAAVATVAFVLLGPGARRAAVGVRVHGVPANGTSVLALRLVGVQRLSGVDDAVPLDGLTVTASAGGQAWRPSGATDPTAWPRRASRRRPRCTAPSTWW